MKKLFKSLLALALVLTIVSSVTLVPTNPSNKGEVSTLGAPEGWPDWGMF